jgi:hypothetical protein
MKTFTLRFRARKTRQSPEVLWDITLTGQQALFGATLQSMRQFVFTMHPQALWFEAIEDGIDISILTEE